MRVVRLLALAGLVAASVAVSGAPAALACSCAFATAEEHAAFSDAIFTGTVAEHRSVGDRQSFDSQAVYTIEVDDVDKGSVGARQELGAQAGGASLCGVSFPIGFRYRFFAFRNEDGRLGTNSCSRSEVPLDAAVAATATPSGAGLWVATRRGTVLPLGDAIWRGAVTRERLRGHVVGIAAASDAGYWLAAADGGIFAFGDAPFHGSLAGSRLARPVVGIAATPTGGGYWMVAADGGVFAFGDARFAGSLGARRLARPVVGMTPTPTGFGYWLVAADGGVFAFGDAPFVGSMSGVPLNADAVGIAGSGSGRGYRVTAADGGVFAFGDARIECNAVGETAPTVAITARSGGGHWLASTDTVPYEGIAGCGEAPDVEPIWPGGIDQ